MGTPSLRRTDMLIREATMNQAATQAVVAPAQYRPDKAGDRTAMTMLAEIKDGAPEASKRTHEAYYHAEPIIARKGCLRCHGSPRGAPDPFFPQYKKNGWEEGAVIGAVVARVTCKADA